MGDWLTHVTKEQVAGDIFWGWNRFRMCWDAPVDEQEDVASTTSGRECEGWGSEWDPRIDADNNFDCPS